MKENDPGAVILEFMARGQRTQRAVDEVIASIGAQQEQADQPGSPSEPKPAKAKVAKPPKEPKVVETRPLPEQFEQDHYWGIRAVMDEAMEADDDQDYRTWVSELRRLVRELPT